MLLNMACVCFLYNSTQLSAYSIPYTWYVWNHLVAAPCSLPFLVIIAYSVWILFCKTKILIRSRLNLRCFSLIPARSALCDLSEILDERAPLLSNRKWPLHQNINIICSLCSNYREVLIYILVKLVWANCVPFKNAVGDYGCVSWSVFVCGYCTNAWHHMWVYNKPLYSIANTLTVIFSHWRGMWYLPIFHSSY